ncbi:sensor histidine kinase [Paenibacillus sp. 1001270B_150601_E10]|uniref:sensor histidine kinase n=1 Tax=Paenibacillus sp. 1001270B_150601_E10 TaxID=2787079 RepID=UPI00189C9E21|nr:HAMP domain-containing sensor histidine kinase [Paenibacillus sp. 1001270B_150601_E10]
MILSMIGHQVTGILYVMSACLCFLIITPRFTYSNNRRKLLFVAILALLSLSYLSLETIDPFIYCIHLIPISIVLASLFEGTIAGIATWIAFNFGNIFILGNDIWPTMLASTVLLCMGLVFHRTQVERSTFLQINLLAFTLTTVYLLVFLLCYEDWPSIEGSPIGLIVIGTYISTMLVSYIYYHVKNQEKLREELYDAEKYQVIGQLAASISHEVRNPLTTAHGFLQLMRNEKLSRDVLEKYRSFAIEGIDQANSIITDYLNFAKPTVGNHDIVHIQAAIDSLISMVSPLCVLSKVELNIKHYTAYPVYVKGDTKKFQQSLLNIMKNAIESMPDGGHLRVSTWCDNEGVHIQIQDTGVGMSEYEIKRIGMPFYTTKEKGTGLGLMVVVSSVRAMNGKISYYSRPREGTTCVLQFRRMHQN